MTHSNNSNMILRHEYEIQQPQNVKIFKNWPAAPAIKRSTIKQIIARNIFMKKSVFKGWCAQHQLRKKNQTISILRLKCWVPFFGVLCDFVVLGGLGGYPLQQIFW